MRVLQQCPPPHEEVARLRHPRHLAPLQWAHVMAPLQPGGAACASSGCTANTPMVRPNSARPASRRKRLRPNRTFESCSSSISASSSATCVLVNGILDYLPSIDSFSVISTRPLFCSRALPDSTNSTRAEAPPYRWTFLVTVPLSTSRANGVLSRSRDLVSWVASGSN